MKKYITPTAKAVFLYEENDIMLQTGSSYADEQYSNQKNEPSGESSIWED